MKKLIVMFLILFSANTVVAAPKGQFSFLGRFLKRSRENQEEKKVKAPQEIEEIRQENSLIPVVQGEEIPAYLEFTYVLKDDPSKKRRDFQIPVVALAPGDRRPAEIGALEGAITRERTREKIVPMMKYYEKAFARHLNDISDDPEKIYQLGNQYFLNSRFEKAKDIFSKNIETVDNLFGSAVTNRFLGYDDTAIAYYSEVIEMNPSLAEPYLGRGISYRNLGKYDEALRDFLEYKSMTDREEAYSALGNIYLLKENHKEAKRILKQGRMLYPKSKLINDLLVKAYGK